MFKKILFAGLLAISSSAVMALPIVGNIDISNAVGSGWSPNPAPIGTTTGVAFNANASLVDGIVTDSTGSYAGTNGENVDFNDFTFNPLTAGTTLWSFTQAGTVYSLVMDTATISFQDTNIIALQGAGTLKITGFDDTFANWNLTLNKFSGAGSYSASAVPAPAALALLGLGLVGLTLVRRKNKAA